MRLRQARKIIKASGGGFWDLWPDLPSPEDCGLTKRRWWSDSYMKAARIVVRAETRLCRKRDLALAFKRLVEFEPKGDEPCDDRTCRSCYVGNSPTYNHL